jgi:protocatechuate 3,4-dioxygenase alpha subunit
MNHILKTAEAVEGNAAMLMNAQQENFGQTPSQTVGPYFAYGLTASQYGYPFDQPFDAVVAPGNARGERIRLEGLVIDGDGKPISDALIEICQADGEGRYPSDVAEADAMGFRGFGRCGTGTDAQSRFIFDTVKPAAQAAGEAPHIDVIVLMRGLLLHAFSRIYFSDEAAANEGDAVFQSVPEKRRPTLIAQRTQEAGRVCYRFDIHMQGPKETVFFDV